MKCRHCASPLELTFVDLGESPPSNSYISAGRASEPETVYPLRVLVCKRCWLVQTEDFADREELFSSDYAYFSSYSSTWLSHCKTFVERMRSRFRLDSSSLVIEVAANDGYLLQYVKEKGIPCLGIEPTHSTAEVARQRGLTIIEEFFGQSLGKQLTQTGHSADMIVANNVVAHVPDINDFLSGICLALKPEGVASLEFPHLLRLREGKQFDTIYHEHYSYLSLVTVQSIAERVGMKVFDVQELPTHGGSLRVLLARESSAAHSVSPAVRDLTRLEEETGVKSEGYYRSFQRDSEKIRDAFRKFVVERVDQGETLGAYGAAAKGNTLLNFSRLNYSHIAFVSDLNEQKQGKLLPGSHIPIVDEEFLKVTKPDYVLILPWNLKSEICDQLSYIRDWGGKFVTAIPKLEVF